MVGFSRWPTFLMSSRKEALSPLNLAPEGPERLRLATTLSSFREDRHLAKTASPREEEEENSMGKWGPSIPPITSDYADFMVIGNKTKTPKHSTSWKRLNG